MTPPAFQAEGAGQHCPGMRDFCISQGVKMTIQLQSGPVFFS